MNMYTKLGLTRFILVHRRYFRPPTENRGQTTEALFFLYARVDSIPSMPVDRLFG